MSDQGISESRFYMWRAVFALAHADGKVTEEERNFVDNYLLHVPFSEEQRAIILHDIEEPQETGEMLTHVSDPEDQGTFFQFAQMMAQADGEYDHWEQSAVQNHLGEQMRKFNLGRMEETLRLQVMEARERNRGEKAKVEAEAAQALSLSGMIKRMVAGRKKQA